MDMSLERRTSSGHAWQSWLSARREGGQIVLTVPVRLLPDVSIPAGAVRPRAISWEQTAEQVWSDRVGLRIGAETLPLRVDLRFDPPTDPAARVIVLPGQGPADLGAWRLDNPPAVAAHEVGHLLGAWDEYEGGAQDPTTPIVDLAHIMGRETTSPVPHPRSFEPLAAELGARLGVPVTVVAREAP